MTESVTNLLIWAVGILVAIIQVLIGIIIRMHTNTDAEHRARVEKFIAEVQVRLDKLEAKRKLL